MNVKFIAKGMEIKECDNIPFALLYGVILNYLRTFKIENNNLNLDTCVRMFTFNRCDQNTYLDEIKGVYDKKDLDIEFANRLGEKDFFDKIIDHYEMRDWND